MYSSFAAGLLKEIVGSMDNHHTDNYDVHRFGEASAERKESGVPEWVKNVESVEPFLGGLQNTFALLSDEESKYLLVGIFAYRILGHRRVRLPLSQPFYWEMVNSIEQRLLCKKDTKKLDFHGWSLDLFDLNPLGFPVFLNLTPKAVLTIFGLEHYCFTPEIFERPSN
jgi:hypothetical protein